MQNQPDLIKLQRKSFLHLEQDGLMEIYGGLLIIAAGLLWKSIFVILIISLAGVLGPRFVEEFRRKYTYPRIGYAKFINSGQDQRVIFVVLFFIISCIVFAIVFRLKLDSSDFLHYGGIYLPALGGVAMAAGCIVSYYKYGTYRYLLYFPICLGLGIYFSFFNAFPIDTKLSAMLLAVGSLILLTGLLVFYRFVRKNRLHTEVEFNGQ
ncbi:MAG: hypothetical protein FVQ81_05980 [Candidatus Glassbacteria bacterium]|nr:hypothetical protein [Candidatus Glassbacteria bacterium]